jgi:hypothetical protein
MKPEMEVNMYESGEGWLSVQGVSMTLSLHNPETSEKEYPGLFHQHGHVVSQSDLKEFVNRVYIAGRRSAQKEMRDALGISDVY